MKILVLGPGCRNCRALEERTKDALSTLHIDAEIEKVTDYATIASYGVLATPGLVIDGDVVISGRVPTTDWLTEALRSRTSTVAR